MKDGAILGAAIQVAVGLPVVSLGLGVAILIMTGCLKLAGIL